MRIYRSDHRGDGAFSYIELVLVLAIITVVAAVAAPRYFGAMANYRADAAARRLAADLELAREAARAASAPRSITFDNANDRYRTAAGDAVELTDEPYGAVIVSVVFSPAAPVNGGDPGALTFDGYGKPGRTCMITLAAGDTQRTVTVGASSGEVSVR